MLSPLDEVIGRIASFLARANDEDFNEVLYVEGELLERWLLKTVINNAVAGWLGPKKWLPTADVVSAIFGRAPIPDGIGLYSVEGGDPLLTPAGGVSALPIFLGNERQLLGGAYISVHGMPLFAAFHTDLAAQLEVGDLPTLKQRFTSSGLKHLYHPGAIVMSRQRGRPVVLGISWKGVLRFADGTTAPFPPKS